jgi:hypothetical protein
MKNTQVTTSVTEDPTLTGLRRLAQDIGDEMILSWLDALAKGERTRSSATSQPQTNHGPKDIAM